MIIKGRKLTNKAFTLLELIVVLIVIGVLGTLAVSQFQGRKETTLDREAIINLKLIQAAERIYSMEMDSYYPPAGSDSNTSTINGNLKLLLRGDNWAYAVWSSGCARATRLGRSFFFTIGDDGEPDTGAGCP